MTASTAAPTSRKTFARALFEAIHTTLREDPRQTIHGEYIFGLQNIGLMDELHAEFPDRIIERPCAEAVAAAVGVGAAMAGVPSFIELSTGSFSFLSWSQIINEASVGHYLSNGELSVPVLFHIMHGIRGGGGVQHSISPQSMFWNVPGLEIVMPSTPYDAKGLMRRAMKSPNPTVFIEHVKLMALEGDVPEEDYEIPFGVADIKRRGRDLTIVATSHQVQTALAAAEVLAGEGIEVEVVDPRTLAPFDEETILESVRRTGRLIALDESTLRCGVASEMTATVAEKAFSSLKAPPLRLTRANAPVAFSPTLEGALLPTQDEICAAVRRLVGVDA